MNTQESEQAESRGPTPTDHSPSQGYSLGAMMATVATCGVLMAIASAMSRSSEEVEQNLGDYLRTVGSTALLMGAVGAVLAIGFTQRLVALIWGSLTGALAGIVAGMGLLAPRDYWTQVWSAAAGGALFLFLMGLYFRRAAAARQREKERAAAAGPWHA